MRHFRRKPDSKCRRLRTRSRPVRNGRHTSRGRPVVTTPSRVLTRSNARTCFHCRTMCAGAGVIGSAGPRYALLCVVSAVAYAKEGVSDQNTAVYALLCVRKPAAYADTGIRGTVLSQRDRSCVRSSVARARADTTTAVIQDSSRGLSRRLVLDRTAGNPIHHERCGTVCANSMRRNERQWTSSNSGSKPTAI